MSIVHIEDRSDAVLILGALGAALVAFQRWGPAGAVAVAVVAGMVGLRRTLPASLSLAAAGAAGAALIHFAVAPEHFGEWWGFGTFFVVCGEIQLGWALLLRRRPTGAVLATGLGGSLLLVALWLLSRTAGLPFGPEPGVPEAIGVADLASVSLELLTAAACLRVLTCARRPLARPRLARLAALFAAALTAWALLAVNGG